MMRLDRVRAGINQLAREALAPVPLRFWETAFPKDLIALCYHMVSDDELQHIALYPYKTAAQFEADVVFARSRAVTYRQVVESRLGGTSLPRNSVLFTFDDGMAECYSVIRPILQRHGVDGVFFVTTGFLDDAVPFFECMVSRCLTAARRAPLERIEAALAQCAPHTRLRGRTRADPSERSRRALVARLMRLKDGDLALIARIAESLGAGEQGGRYFMSRDEVKGLAADGFTVGAHGLMHRSLEHLDIREVEREIVASCDIVREITGQARVPFAFPYRGILVDRSAINDILRRNPLVDLVFDSGCLRRDPKFIVNRVFTDAPPQTSRTNLPATLRDAWSIPSAWFDGTAAS